MKNLYLTLWVDAIVNAKSYKMKTPGWKSRTLWLLTTSNVLNVMLVLLWLDFFQLYKHNFFFNFHADSFAVGLLEIFLNIFAPIGIINYFLIFYKERYKRLIATHRHYNGKFALYYTLISIFLIVITVIFKEIVIP
ncbi:hypothetical protein DSECCO2_625500 [anaerobic digester metagenome]